MKLERQNGSLELMLSLFAALMLSATALVWLVIPQVKVYSLLDRKCEAEKQQTLRMQQTYDRLYEARQFQGGSDAAIAEAFENDLDAAGLAQWLKSYLGPCDVVPEPAEQGRAQRVTVIARLQSPVAFYDLLEALGESPYVLELQVPVLMHRTAAGIETTLHFRVAGSLPEASD